MNLNVRAKGRGELKSRARVHQKSENMLDAKRGLPSLTTHCDEKEAQ